MGDVLNCFDISLFGRFIETQKDNEFGIKTLIIYVLIVFETQSTFNKKVLEENERKTFLTIFFTNHTQFLCKFVSKFSPDEQTKHESEKSL